jgi:hypothetical protein
MSEWGAGPYACEACGVYEEVGVPAPEGEAQAEMPEVVVQEQ